MPIRVVSVGAGVMPGIAARSGGGWLTVHREPGTLLRLIWWSEDGLEQARQAIDVGTAADSTFPVLVTWRSRQFVGYRGLRNGLNVACLREIAATFLGPEVIAGETIGNWPLCLSTDGWFAWQDPAGTVEGLSLDSGERRTLRAEIRPTGLASVEGGAVVFCDENRGRFPDMLDPVTAGDCTVGKALTGGIRVHLPDRQGTLFPGHDTGDPRIAAGLDGYAAISWAVPGIVQLALFTADDVIEPPPAVSVPAVNRALVMGWFTDRATPAPGNANVLVDFHGAPAANALVRRDTGELLAHYVAAEADGTIEGLERAITASHAADPRVPTVCYWPTALQAVRVPIGADLVGVVAYRGVDETLEDFEMRVRLAVSVCPAAMLIAQGYTSNAANTADLASLVPVYARIARDCRNVLGLLVFSAGSRATGFDAHPEVADLWRALYASVLGVPTLPAPHVTPVPPPSPRPPRPSPPPVPVPPPPPATRFPAARIYGVRP